MSNQEVVPTPSPEVFSGRESQKEYKEEVRIVKKIDSIYNKHFKLKSGQIDHPEIAIDSTYDLVSGAAIGDETKADLLVHTGDLFGLMSDDDSAQLLDEKIQKEYLPAILGPHRYQLMSQEVGHVLRVHREVPAGFFGESNGIGEEDDTTALDVDTLTSKLPTLSSLSPAVRTKVLERLAGLRLITETQTGYAFPEKKKAQKYLLSGQLELTEGWAQAKRRFVDGSNIQTLEDYESTLEEHDRKRAIPEIILETDKDGFAIAPINALKLGHQDSLEGVRLVREYLHYVSSLPEAERPDVLLVSDLMQGVFKHNQSQKRSAIPSKLQDANAQFRTAHELIDEMRATGIKVVVTMGENDHREARDYATDAVRELQELLSDGEKNDFVHFGQLYKYSQNAMWQDFRQFALDYAIPLQQKYGRRLRTGEEMSVDSQDTVSQSEFMHLYEHVRLGYRLNPATGIDPDDLLEPGSWSADGSIVYVDDCDLVFKLRDQREERVKYRHALGLTAESLSSNHMKNAQKLMGALGMAAATIDDLPSALMTGQQKEAAMVTYSGVDIVSNPGLTNPMNSIDTRAFYRRTNGDDSLRALTSRGRAWTPGVYEYSRPSDGVVKYTMYDNDVMERSESIPRMAIVTFNDFQIGSPTAHLDMIVHGYALAQRYAERMPVAIHGEGDFIQGFIYPNMAREAQAIGLMDLDSQAEMNNGLIRDTWQDAPVSVKDGVFDLMWQWGNHDEEQRVRAPGNHSRNVDSTLEVWKNVLNKPDLSQNDHDREVVVRSERVFQGDDGTPVPTWIGRPRYGDVNMVISHFHINSKNYKGGNGGLAVYDPLKRVEGMGGFEDIQIASGAHHHNRMHLKANGLWVDIGDANAAGQSEFENMLGMHHSSMSVKVREIGGGLPMTVTYYTEKALMDEPVKYGPYAPEQLSDAGFFDDPGADPLRFGMYSLDGSPKTAEQKRLWVKQREASQWANHMSEGLHVPRGHQNRVTRRLFEVAARQGLIVE